jgi:hypothetical protein
MDGIKLINNKPLKIFLIATKTIKKNELDSAFQF